MTSPMDTRGERQRDILFVRHLTRGGNLVDEPVTLAATTLAVVFDLAEQDVNYGVHVTPSWLTTVSVALKSTTGYMISFGTGAPADATVDTTTFRTER